MAIGPGSTVTQTENPKPMLWFASDNDVIQVLNPLTEDFIGLVGNSQPQNTPFEIRKTQGLEAATASEADAQRTYGLNLKNPDHFSPAQITTKIVLPAGQTISLLGGVAKVVVTQLVNEIMQREHNTLKMADPTARNEVEQRVIFGQGTVQQYLPENYQTEREQINHAINNVNQGASNEQQPFPSEGREGTPGQDRGTENPSSEPQRRSPGRPKKSADPS